MYENLEAEATWSVHEKGRAEVATLGRGSGSSEHLQSIHLMSDALLGTTCLSPHPVLTPTRGRGFVTTIHTLP